MIEKIREELFSLADPQKAVHQMRFFKTAEGEYGYGDVFLGITVPQIRSLVKIFAKDTAIGDIPHLLCDKYHECRMAALLMLVYKYGRSTNEDEKQRIFDIYTGNIQYINNWDLVDLSAPAIVGKYLSGSDCSLLYKFIDGGSLWEQRVAVVSTLTFIRDGNFHHTFEMARRLMDTKQDLMQKASGWMLREAGKRNKDLLIAFLNENRRNMPRTMLRYAIEKFSAEERRFFMGK